MMRSSEPSRGRLLVLALALLLTAYGVWGMMAADQGYTGALYWPDYTIRQVLPGTPLAEAGFLPGDSVVGVEGIPVTELGMYSRWPRSLSRKAGETLTMTVDRDGALVSGEIRYREPLSSVRGAQLGAAFIVFSFLWIGVWAFWTIPSPHATRLAAMGLALGFALPGPNLGTLNGVRDHLQMAGMVLWTLLVFRFFLLFPEPKRIARGHLTTAVIYWPWMILLGCLVLEFIYHPRFYHSFGGYGALLMSAYGLLAVVALLHSWLRLSKGELRSTGMGRVLLGVGLGVGGLLVWVVDAALLQGFDIPFSGWLPLLLVGIPLGMALGVRKGAELTPSPAPPRDRSGQPGPPAAA
ncbi:MAG: PDZ domain-containing protein, partial [Longimicrobiales bacterium]